MYQLKTEATNDKRLVFAGLGVGVEDDQLLASTDKSAIESEAQGAIDAKADLLERRLSQIESALDIPSICAG